MPASIQTAIGFSIAIAGLHVGSLIVAFLSRSNAPLGEFAIGRITGSILMAILAVIITFGLVKREGWALVLGVLVYGLAFGGCCLLVVLVLIADQRDKVGSLLLLGVSCIVLGVPFFTILINRISAARAGR